MGVTRKRISSAQFPSYLGASDFRAYPLAKRWVPDGKVERRRKDDGYRVIALLLPGIEPSDLARWFDEEPVGVPVEVKTGGVSEALPQILAALGERLPDDKQSIEEPDARPVAELKLKLKGASTENVGEGKWRAKATPQLIYAPADRTIATRHGSLAAKTLPRGTGKLPGSPPYLRVAGRTGQRRRPLASDRNRAS
jgi:hypothetical protein